MKAVSFVSFAVNSELEVAATIGLDHLCARLPAMPPEVITSLGHDNAARRAFAACIVGHRGTLVQQDRVRRLLTDPDLNVRLRAAQGLLAGGQKDAIPALIALLEATPPIWLGKQKNFCIGRLREALRARLLVKARIGSKNMG